MKIACLGWGSLIWRPENLLIQNKWFEDGPLLPIEFTRVSMNNRVTLIIDEEAKPVRTLWALMTPSQLSDCIDSLRIREGTNVSNIQSVSLNDKNTENIRTVIKEWVLNNNLDCAIWTALSFSNKTNEKRPSINYIIRHLDKLKGNERRNAEEYIRKAPKQIDTEYRREIEAKLGWSYLE